jgi:GntR family transcriptional repressor for pyruvate dehydrogenase complex
MTDILRRPLSMQMTPDTPHDGAVQHPTRRPKRRAELVVDYVKGEMTSGRLAAGDRLPTEHEIAGRLGVSRNSVREAVRVLQAAGLVDVRHGTGSFVREGVEASIAHLMLFRTLVAQSSPASLIEVRRLFERSCAELAAQRRTDADLAAMRDAIGRLRRLAGEPSASQAALLEADLDFHRAVYRASGNELIASLADFVLASVAPWVERSLARQGGARTADLHEAEYQRILARDADAARDGATTSAQAADRNMEYWREGLAE